jgi:hypothetical protein
MSFARVASCAGLLLLGSSACQSGSSNDTTSALGTKGTQQESKDAGTQVAERDAAPAPCQGRGQSLDGLSVEGGGGLSLKVKSVDPDPPVVGDNSWRVALSLDGEPLAGVADEILVSPFMPDHGHGSPVSVGVSELSDGVYRFEPVNTFMPGYWEITVRVQGDAGESSVMFGVCIE